MEDKSWRHESNHREDDRGQSQDRREIENHSLWGARESHHREVVVVVTGVKKKDVAESTSDVCEKMEEKGRR